MLAAHACFAHCATQAFDKLRKQSDEQRQHTKDLLQDRSMLQQQVQALTAQAREHADKLRRLQLQKQRLENLCRSLQVRAGADHLPGNTAAQGAAACVCMAGAW